MRILEWDKTTALLKKFRIPCAEYYSVNGKDVAEKAGGLGYPLVMKALSPKIVHKTEEGFVKAINSEEGLTKAFEDVRKKLSKRKIKAEIVLQKFVEGTEVIIGAKEDPTFGKTIMFGLGGVLVELIKDTSFRIVPVDEKEAEEMIKEIRGGKLLEGYRGKKANVKKLAELIAKVSKLCEKNEVRELDLNPVIANEEEATVVDARLVC